MHIDSIGNPRRFIKGNRSCSESKDFTMEPDFTRSDFTLSGMLRPLRLLSQWRFWRSAAERREPKTFLGTAPRWFAC